MGLLDAAMNIAGDVLTTRMNNANAKAAFQRQLNASDTQYQRSVADLKAAGLNPMLAYMGSVDPTPNAQVASYDFNNLGSLSASADSAEASASSARAVAKKTATVDTEKTSADTVLSQANADLAAANKAVALAQVPATNAQTAATYQSAKESAARTLKTQAEQALVKQQTRSAAAEAGKAEVTKGAYDAAAPAVKWLQTQIAPAMSGAKDTLDRATKASTDWIHHFQKKLHGGGSASGSW